MRYWLLKSEPDCFSWSDLQNSPHQSTAWDGVRNFQARNFMRTMQLGDKGFFYHSGKKSEITGIVEIIREAYADHTAWDRSNKHFDPRSTPEKPLWFMVDIRLLHSFTTPLSRTQLKNDPALIHMELMKKGSRLSVQEVSTHAFTHILKLADM